jgi:hypothetical protein
MSKEKNFTLKKRDARHASLFLFWIAKKMLQ